MLPNVGRSGEYAAACMAAVMIVGMVYVGILLLNEAPVIKEQNVVEGAIRLAQEEKDKPLEDMSRKMPEESKPPEPLPKEFTARSRAQESKPVLSVSVPAFSIDAPAGLAGGIAVPAGDYGGSGFSMDEVDTLPQAVRSVPPQYPFVARRNALEGTVVIRMLVTVQGEVEQLSVESAVPEGVFEKAALAAAARWRFHPGKYKGRAVDTWILLPFKFELE